MSSPLKRILVNDYSPYISVMSFRNWAALISDNLSSFFFNLSLLMVRIWSTAISAFLFAHLIWSRVLHSGCNFDVKGQTTTVSKYLFISSWLMMTTGRTFLISLPVVGLRSAIYISYMLIFKALILQTVQKRCVKIVPLFLFIRHGFIRLFPGKLTFFFITKKQSFVCFFN